MFLLGGLRFARRQEFTAGMCATPSAWTKRQGGRDHVQPGKTLFSQIKPAQTILHFYTIHLKGVFQQHSDGQHEETILPPFFSTLLDRKVLAAPALEAARTSKATEDNSFSTCLFVCLSFAPHWLCPCQSDSSRF